jgi:hypothetical protein
MRPGVGIFFTVPAHRRLSCIPRPRTTPLPISARSKHALIENQRKRLVDEMTELRKARGPSACATHTTQVLLTRHWIKANWAAREQLIKAVHWLVQGIR